MTYLLSVVPPQHTISSLFLKYCFHSQYQMEATSTPEQESAGLLTRGCHWLKTLPNKFCAKVMEIVGMTKKLGLDDPRRIIHSLKFGLALTLVSLFYYFKPLYDGFGVSAMWAVLTVVVVFEFSVGKYHRSGFTLIILCIHICQIVVMSVFNTFYKLNLFLVLFL